MKRGDDAPSDQNEIIALNRNTKHSHAFSLRNNRIHVASIECLSVIVVYLFIFFSRNKRGIIHSAVQDGRLVNDSNNNHHQRILFSLDLFKWSFQIQFHYSRIILFNLVVSLFDYSSFVHSFARDRSSCDVE